MLTRRLNLLGLALSLAAGAAVAANPAPASAASGGTARTTHAPAKSETAARTEQAKEQKPNGIEAQPRIEHEATIALDALARDALALYEPIAAKRGIALSSALTSLSQGSRCD